jgi:hypothetical protein
MHVDTNRFVEQINGHRSQSHWNRFPNRRAGLHGPPGAT